MTSRSSKTAESAPCGEEGEEPAGVWTPPPELGQGYHLARPLDAEGFEGLLGALGSGDWREADTVGALHVAEVKGVAS